MQNAELREINCPPPVTREKICSLEKAIASMPGSMIGDCFPLTHTFPAGLYVREIRVPAGNLIVTKIFKQENVTFLLAGEVSIATERGVERLKAPCTIITKVGTKRVIFCHEDVVWTTVHPNPSEERDLDRLEDGIIAKNFDGLPLTEDENTIIDMVKQGSA